MFMNGIGKKILSLALTAAVMMIAAAVFAVICAKNDADGVLVVGTIIAVVVFIAALIFLAYKTSKSITTPIEMLTVFIKVVAYQGQVQFSEDNWVIARRMAQAKDETGAAFSGLNDMVLRFEKTALLLQKVAEGDFTVKPETLGELDLIGNSIIKVVGDLNRTLSDIGGVTKEVKSGADMISGVAQNLAQGSTEQAATLEELSASIEQVTAKTKESSELARNEADLSKEVMGNAEKGSQAMDQLTAAVDDITAAAKDISKVIHVIDDIAFQTNILALNAAVEAARAGDSGKGFAVVADEVRNLARKSAEAAKETEALIENSMKKALLGSEIAKDTAASLNEMVDGVTKSAAIIAEIADRLEAQDAAIEQINLAVSQVSDVVAKNASSAEESAAASEQLDSQSEILAQNVAMFKVS
jgi:methyl-accepting chemotaxis protein